MKDDFFWAIFHKIIKCNKTTCEIQYYDQNLTWSFDCFHGLENLVHVYMFGW